MKHLDDPLTEDEEEELLVGEKMEAETFAAGTVVLAVLIGLGMLFILGMYIVGWAIFFIAGTFFGYAWPGFWTAFSLGVAIWVLVIIILVVRDK